MRYIKIPSKPLLDINLKKWEQVIIEIMEIKPFFLFTELDKQYYLAYVNDDSYLNIFDQDHMKNMFVEELYKEDIKNIIHSQSPNYRCKFNKNGTIDIQIKIIDKYCDINNKPYKSWLWNYAEKKWQAPVAHPIQPESMFIWNDISKKWIKNDIYSSYSWDEEKNRWIHISEYDKVVV